MFQLTHGSAYSSRHAVRLIVPGVGDSCGNVELPAARGAVVEYIRAAVVTEVRNAQRERGNWPAFTDITVSVRENFSHRGAYAVTVYGTKKG